MTQFRADPNRLSNWFDRILDGAGQRGSSFSDIDAITHDGVTERFLIQEFKHEGEVLLEGQRRLLLALACVPRITVWVVKPLGVWRKNVAWWNLNTGVQEIVSVEDYRARFCGWWAER